MTLEVLKEEYKKSIKVRQMDDRDLDALIEEIDATSTLEEFLEVVSLWSMEADKIGAPLVVLRRILTV